MLAYLDFGYFNQKSPEVIVTRKACLHTLQKKKHVQYIYHSTLKITIICDYCVITAHKTTNVPAGIVMPRTRTKKFNAKYLAAALDYSNFFLSCSGTKIAIYRVTYRHQCATKHQHCIKKERRVERSFFSLGILFYILDLEFQVLRRTYIQYSTFGSHKKECNEILWLTRSII